MSKLSISLLGPFQIALDGKPVMAGLWAKTQALLAYLAAEADTYHRRETLAALIWPDQPDEAARHNLRQALVQLHHAIGEGQPPFLAITPQAIQFNRASDHWLDVARFSDLVQDCQRHTHRRAETCRACIQRLEQAMTLYRGDLLADFALKDSAPFEEWAIIRREQLARAALAALRTLTAHSAVRCDYDAMEQGARRQIEIDPFRESAHRELMRALAWSGQRNAALSQYAALARLLAKELNILPDMETRGLWMLIEADTLPPHPGQPALHNWPVATRRTPLVGRAQELARVAELLQTPGVRLVTLVGPGGIGKTRLALHVAEQETHAFRDGVFFVPLAPPPSSEFIAPTLAQVLGFPLDPTQEPWPQVLTHLRESRRESLLVLDSFEHHMAAAPLIADLLAACPNVTLLVTSREPLHLGCEHVCPVPPLECPDLAPGELEPDSIVSDISRCPSVCLFVDCARTTQPDFNLTPENALAIAAICARLEGVPLSIELAAVHSRLLSLQMISERLTRQLELLNGRAPDLDPRHASLRATCDWSYDELDAREQQLLARLAVFCGGCTLEAIRAVCDDVEHGHCGCEDSLEVLLDKSLVQRQEIEAEARFTLLAVVREYAQERLEASGEADLVRRRHAAFFLRLARQAEVEFAGPRQARWLNRLNREYGNLRAAMEWVRADADAATRSGLYESLWPILLTDAPVEQAAALTAARD